MAISVVASFGLSDHTLQGARLMPAAESGLTAYPCSLLVPSLTDCSAFLSAFCAFSFAFLVLLCKL